MCTYKSSNFSFARRSYSLHKHRPLLKPIMVVTTTGYIVSILGPYLSDSTNNDASILKHMIHCNTEELKTWIKENDVFVVDRGFRDAGEVLKDIGIKMEIPSFMQKGAKQLSKRDSIISRVVTKEQKLHAYVVYSYLLSQIKIIKFVWMQFLD